MNSWCCMMFRNLYQHLSSQQMIPIDLVYMKWLCEYWLVIFYSCFKCQYCKWYLVFSCFFPRSELWLTVAYTFLLSAYRWSPFMLPNEIFAEHASQGSERWAVPEDRASQYEQKSLFIFAQVEQAISSRQYYYRIFM